MGAEQDHGEIVRSGQAKTLSSLVPGALDSAQLRLGAVFHSLRPCADRLVSRTADLGADCVGDVVGLEHACERGVIRESSGQLVHRPACSGLITREIGPGWSVRVVILAVAAVFAASSMFSWVAYLLFCRWLVGQSRDPSSLREAAVAARAFRGAAPAAIAQGIAKLAGGYWRRGGS